MTTSTGIILLPIATVPSSDGSYLWLWLVNHCQCQGTFSDLSTGARLLQPAAAILSSGPDPNKIVDLAPHAHVLPARRTCSDRTATQYVQQPWPRAATAQQQHSNRKRAAIGAVWSIYVELKFIKICTCKSVCMEQEKTFTLWLRYIQICIALRSAYVYVSACMSAEYSRHTCTYALDTAPMSQDTYGYSQIHAVTGMCISHIHCAYMMCALLYAVHMRMYDVYTYTYINACVSCMCIRYIHTGTGRITDVRRPG